MNPEKKIPVILGIIFILLIVVMFLAWQNPAMEISKAQLIQEINDQNIAKLSISGSKMFLERKDGVKLVYENHQEVKITELVKENNIDSEIFTAIEVEIGEPKDFYWVMVVVMASLLPILILGMFYVAPLLLIAGVILIMRNQKRLGYTLFLGAVGAWILFFIAQFLTNH